MQVITTTHVSIDENGVAWIAGTNTKVIEVVRDRTVLGLSPEQIHEQYPYLSLAQIYSALAYYYDSEAALDIDIKRRYEEVEEMRKKAGDSPIARELKELGKL